MLALTVLLSLAAAAPGLAQVSSGEPEPGTLGGGQVGTGAVTLPRLPSTIQGASPPADQTPPPATTLTSTNPTGARNTGANASGSSGGSSAGGSAAIAAETPPTATTNSATPAASLGSSRAQATVLCLPAGVSDGQVFLDGTGLNCAP